MTPKGSYAVAFLNTKDTGGPFLVNVSMTTMGISNSSSYEVTEVFEGTQLGYLSPDKPYFRCRVNPTGVYMIKAKVKSVKSAYYDKPYIKGRSNTLHWERSKHSKPFRKSNKIL